MGEPGAGPAEPPREFRRVRYPARLLSALYPSSIANLPATSNNYFATVPGTGYSYNGVAKVDINFTDKERLSVHWFGGQGSQTQPPGASLALATASSNLGYYFEVAPLHVQNYSTVLSSVFSNKLTNQLLAGVSYFNQIFHDANNSFNMAALGLESEPGRPGRRRAGYGSFQHRNQRIRSSGHHAAGRPQRYHRPFDGHAFLCHRAGTSSSSAASSGRVAWTNSTTAASTGIFKFDGTQGPWANSCGASPTTSCADTIALADFLAGDVSTSSIAVGDAERKVLVNGFDFFAQDNWQVTPKLNLNFGLRWEYFGPLHSNEGNNLGVFEPGQGLGDSGSRPQLDLQAGLS